MFPLIRLAVAASLIATSAQSALLIYYPLDETSGNVATDAAAGNGLQNATATVAASNWQALGGIIGGALQLSPTAQADVDEALIYNTANTSISLLSSTPFTLTLWVNSTSTLGANRAGVFLGNSTGTSLYYAVGFNATHQSQMIARSATQNIAIVSPTAQNDGVWHQFTAVYSATNSRTFYLDGKLVGTSATDVTHPVLNRFGVGALTRSTQTDAFSGLIDEVGFFDTAATAQEAALYNAFPRYDAVRLDDGDYALALNVFNTQSGSVDTGTWDWSYATGLSGPLGTTGFVGAQPYVVLDGSGNGLIATPEPATAAIMLIGLAAVAARRHRVRAA